MVRRLVCEECGCVSRGDAEGWAAFLGADLPGRPPLPVGIFCPRCAALELDYRIDAGVEYT